LEKSLAPPTLYGYGSVTLYDYGSVYPAYYGSVNPAFLCRKLTEGTLCDDGTTNQAFMCWNPTEEIPLTVWA
jgi:hypothetical protein